MESELVQWVSAISLGLFVLYLIGLCKWIGDFSISIALPKKRRFSKNSAK